MHLLCRLNFLHPAINVTLDPGFSIWARLIFQPDNNSRHCKMSSSIPSFYPLDASSTPFQLQRKNISRHFQMSPGCKILAENHCSRLCLRLSPRLSLSLRVLNLVKSPLTTRIHTRPQGSRPTYTSDFLILPLGCLRSISFPTRSKWNARLSVEPSFHAVLPVSPFPFPQALSPPPFPLPHQVWLTLTPRNFYTSSMVLHLYHHSTKSKPPPQFRKSLLSTLIYPLLFQSTLYTGASGNFYNAHLIILPSQPKPHW